MIDEHDELSAQQLKKLNPVVRRKFLATLVGSSIGAVAALSAPKADAFIGFTLEELFEMFLEEAGEILMMFCANRFYKNFIEAFDAFTEMTKDSRAKENGLLGGAFQNSLDYEMNFASTQQDSIFQRKTETSGRICEDTQQGALVVQAMESSKINTKHITSGQSSLLFDSQFDSHSNYVSSYLDLVSSNQTDSQVSINNLSQIFGTAGFDDIESAQRELTLVLADIVRSPDHDVLAWKDGVSDSDPWKPNGTKSQVKKAVENVSRSTQANILLEGIAYAMARRVPSKSLTEAMFTTLLGAGKNKAKTALNNDGPYFCSAEALMLEVESKSLEAGYLEEMNSYADATPVLYYFNNQYALYNRLIAERHKVSALRANIGSINAILESELNRLSKVTKGA